MTPEETTALHAKLDRVLDVTTENREELKAINGRLRGVELWRARLEGALFGWRARPVVAALGATGAGWVAVLR